MAKLGIGVLGLGRMGKVYASHIARQLDSAQLVAVADPLAGVADSAAAALGGPRAFTNYHDLLALKEVEAIVVTTPTSTHREVVIAAAQAGKAIFCEKPTALTLPETDEMKVAVDKAGVFFQVGFMRRFDKGYAAAKKQLEAGAIGKPATIRCISRDPFRTSLEYANPAASGGILVDMGIHDFDLCRWLMQDEIDTVYAQANALIYPELTTVGDVDNAMVFLRYKGDALGYVEASRTARYGYDIQTEIIGTDGALRIGYLQETPVLTLTKDGARHDVVPHFPERFGPAYTNQIAAFVDNLANGKPSNVTFEDARAALQAAIAATRSQHEGKPVKVSDIK